MLGAMVAVRCPQDFAALMLAAGGQWEPGSRRWLVERRRIGPLIRPLERATDPYSGGLECHWTVAFEGSSDCCPSPHRRDGTLRSRPG
jgi:hypothetical protein